MTHPSVSKSKAQYRRVSLLRHAKAAEESSSGGDEARSLNPRGREDALKLGDWLRQNHTLPDLVICSTAQRTRETLAALKITLPTILSKRAYLASPGELLSLLQETDDAVQHVMLIGHNPGLHQLIALLVADCVREADAELLAMKFPTSAFVSMGVKAPHWRDLGPQTGELDALAIGSKL